MFGRCFRKVCIHRARFSERSLKLEHFSRQTVPLLSCTPWKLSHEAFLIGLPLHEALSSVDVVTFKLHCSHWSFGNQAEVHIHLSNVRERPLSSAIKKVAFFWAHSLSSSIFPTMKLEATELCSFYWLPRFFSAVCRTVSTSKVSKRTCAKLTYRGRGILVKWFGAWNIPVSL